MQIQTGKAGFFGVIIILLIILGVSHSIMANSRTSKASIVDAVQNEIKNGLLNPKGAEFSSLDDTSMIKHSDGTYTVTGYVDGTNGFGAKIRSNYQADVTVDDNGYTIDYKLQNAVTGEWQ